MSSIVQRPPGFLLALVLSTARCKLYEQEEGDAAIDSPCIEYVEALDPLEHQPARDLGEQAARHGARRT